VAALDDRASAQGTGVIRVKGRNRDSRVNNLGRAWCLDIVWPAS
jgi:hypothetical protein